jgi:predicted nucleotidyltransferase
MINQATIDEVKNRLVKTYNPLAIYLFGSYAWGVPDQESDLDLLIIVDKCDPKDRHNAMVQGHRALSGMGIPKDILIYTQEQFLKSSKDKSSICYTVTKKGKKIYAKA